MEAIILAGGLGKRLRSIFASGPKPMAPVAGKPFLEVLLNSLAKKGFNRVILSLGYKAEFVISNFGTKFSGMKLEYVREDVPLGTGGATRLALSHCISDHAFIFNGDTFIDLEVDQIECMWRDYQRQIIVSKELKETGRYARLLVDHQRVISFSEKAQSGPGLINAGCYVLAKDSLNDWEIGTPFSLEIDYFPKIVIDRVVYSFKTKGIFIDIGVPEDYRRAQIVLAPYA